MNSAALQASPEILRPRGTTPDIGLPLASRSLTIGLAAVPGLAIMSACNPLPFTSALVEGSAFLLAMVCLLREWRNSEPLHLPRLFFSAVLIPVVGWLQMLFLHSAYPFATLRAVLYWSAPAALILAGGRLLRQQKARSLLLSAIVWLGMAATAMEILQIYGYHRYEVTRTGYPVLSSNYYAELVELILPVVLTRAFRNHRYWWAHLALACLSVSTVLAAAARAGSVLVLIECIALAGMSYKENLSVRARWHKACVVLVLLAAGLTVLQGPVTLIHRLGEPDLLAVRSDVGRSAIAMAGSRPVTGYGLGSFPYVYPAFARFDNGYFVNHVHNDWLEALSDGGVVLFAALAAFVAISAWFGVRAVWGIGLAVLPVHAAVDFPMQRAGVVTLYAVIAAAAVAKCLQQYGQRATLQRLFLRSSRSMTISSHHPNPNF
jgi:O-antigen ligase